MWSLPQHFCWQLYFSVTGRMFVIYGTLLLIQFVQRIGAAEDGAGISLSNELQGYIQILAKESGKAAAFLK